MNKSLVNHTLRTFFLGGFYCVKFAWAQETPSEVMEFDHRPELPMTLQDCLFRSLRDNLDLAVARLNPDVAKFNIEVSRAQFDPVLFGNGQYGQSNTPTGVAGALIDQNQSTTFNTGISQNTEFGTQLQLSANSSYSNTSTSDGFYYPGDYSSFAGFSLTQPLLKGFGTDINLASIRIAVHGAAISKWGFQVQVEQTIVNVVDAYNDLIFFRNSLKLAEDSLDLATKILENNKQRLQIGVMSPLDVSQANAEVASRLETVISAQQAVRDQENVLKRLISQDFLSMENVGIVPVDIPQVDNLKVGALADLQGALHHRADYLQAVEQSKVSGIQLQVARNGTLPQVNLIGNYGYNGLSSNLNSGFKQITGGDYPQWAVGLQVQFPWGNHSALAQAQIADTQKKETDLQIKILEQNILVRLDHALAQVETNRKRLAAAHSASEFAEQSVQAEQEKLDAGTSTTYMVLQLQRDYKTAKTSELQGLADLRKAENDLLLNEGIIMQEYHVEIDPMTSATQFVNTKAKK